MLKKIFIFVLLFQFIDFGIINFIYSAQVEQGRNLLTNWIRLSKTGKDQSEIELFFKDEDPKEMEKVKNRLKDLIILRLRRQKIRKKLKLANDNDDITIIIQTIYEETRFYSLEDDEDLKYRIKEEFKIHPFWFKELYNL